MGIPLWKSVLFFIFLVIVSIVIFPSQRELGLLYTQSMKFAKAELYLAKQFQRDPKDVFNALRYLESLAYRGEVSLVAFNGNRLAKRFPDSINVHEFMAGFYEGHLKMRKAANHWEHIVRINSGRLEEINKLKVYYSLSKNTEGLIRIFETQLKGSRINIDDMYEMARLYSLIKDKRMTKDMYAKIVKEYPHDSQAKIKLAGIYEFENNFEASVELYKDLCNAEPDNPVLAQQLVEKLLLLKKEKEAMKYLVYFKKRFNSSNIFYELLADQYRRENKRNQALQIMVELFERDPNNFELFKSLGEIHYELKSYSQAIEHLRSYHEKTGGDYRSHHILGDVYAAIGDQSSSKEQYRKALNLLREDGE